MNTSSAPDLDATALAQIRTLEEAITGRLNATRSSRARLAEAGAEAERILTECAARTEVDAAALRDQIRADTDETVAGERQDAHIDAERFAAVAGQRHAAAVRLVIARILPETVAR